MHQGPARRWILAATILVVGLLQAWDSDVLEAGLIEWILVGAGILVAAAAALVSEGRAAIFVAIPVSAILLLAAGWISTTPLHGVIVIAVAAGAILLLNEYIVHREAEEARGE
jgi:hypothetical protein